MLRISIPFIIILIFSCNQEREKDEIINSDIKEKSHVDTKNLNIRFDYRAERYKNDTETILINGTLYNDNTDTVYFLSSTCEGMENYLLYDIDKIYAAPTVLCNSSWPIIEKILPKEKIDFIAHFKFVVKSNEIKLGFDFYKIIKNSPLLIMNNFDMQKLKNIYKHSDINRTQLWSYPKKIK